MRDLINSFVGMDKGTRKRTITAFITAVLDFLSVFGIIKFSDPQVEAIQKLALVLITGFVWAYCSHWKNNDFTEEACQGTGLTRQLKNEKKEDYLGEVFSDEKKIEDDVDEQ